MHAHLADRLAQAGSDGRPGFWRSALSGLTPQVVAIVVALLFIRSLSATVDQVVMAASNRELGAWFAHLFAGFGALLMMAVPMLVIIVATANLGPQHGPKRIAALTTAVVLSAGAGSLLRIVHRYWTGWVPAWDDGLEMMVYVWSRYALLGGLLTVAGEFYRREVASIAATQQAEIDRVALERELTAARLQVLETQVEPHFLFNTLANVRRLYDEDPAAGRTMLGKLMRYLDIALPQMRYNESTLERDSELVEAYLHIQRIRMGQRLAFSIDMPPQLRAYHVPPMMLLTLVENAIKHGLNPSSNGGLIRVMARADGGHLVLTVADTGVGFASGSGPGIGLANVCARLAAQFGDRASLALQNNELGGATATIVLPLVGAAEAR